MDYVNLGATGVKVSRLCLGCMTYGDGTKGFGAGWMLDEAASRPFIREALELGINFFDSADVYSRGLSEEILGRALKDFGPSRDRVIIATKVCLPMGEDPNQRGLSRKHIMHAIDDSLRRLGTDYVDLYQIHRHDPGTPMEETLEALTDLIRVGKVRYVGASSMWAWQLAKYLYLADRHGFARFVTMQNFYNLAYREEEREMNPLCRAEGVGLVPWGPMAGGFLAGNRRAETARSKIGLYATRFCRPEDDKVVDAVNAVAERLQAKPGQVALAWLLNKPGLTAPIIGASKPHHLNDAIGALELKLGTEDIAALESVYVPQAVIGHS